MSFWKQIRRVPLSFLHSHIWFRIICLILKKKKQIKSSQFLHWKHHHYQWCEKKPICILNCFWLSTSEAVLCPNPNSATFSWYFFSKSNFRFSCAISHWSLIQWMVKTWEDSEQINCLICKITLLNTKKMLSSLHSEISI